MVFPPAKHIEAQSYGNWIDSEEELPPSPIVSCVTSDKLLSFSEPQNDQQQMSKISLIMMCLSLDRCRMK